MGNNLDVVTASILNTPMLLPLIAVTIYLEELNGAPPISVPFLILKVSVGRMVSLPAFTVSTPFRAWLLLVVAAALKVISPGVLVDVILNGFKVGPSKT